MLDEDHAQCNKGSLPDEIDRVFCHRLKDLDSFLQTRSRTSYSECKGCTAPHVGIIAFTQELDNPGHLVRSFGEDKGQGSHSSPADIIRSIRYSYMQQFAGSAIVGGACVGESDGVDASVSENRILRAR